MINEQNDTVRNPPPHQPAKRPQLREPSIRGGANCSLDTNCFGIQHGHCDHTLLDGVHAQVEHWIRRDEPRYCYRTIAA